MASTGIKTVCAIFQNILKTIRKTSRYPLYARRRSLRKEFQFSTENQKKKKNKFEFSFSLEILYFTLSTTFTLVHDCSCVVFLSPFPSISLRGFCLRLVPFFFTFITSVFSFCFCRQIYDYLNFHQSEKFIDSRKATKNFLRLYRVWKYSFLLVVFVLYSSLVLKIPLMFSYFFSLFRDHIVWFIFQFTFSFHLVFEQIDIFVSLILP